MDWIDEQFLKLKNKLVDASLRAAMIFYLSAAIMAVLLLYVLSVTVAEQWSGLLSYRYYGNGHGILSNPGWDTVKMTWADRALTLTVFFFQSFSIIAYAIAAIIATSVLFYRNKLKRPIELVKKEARHIGRNELDYACKYDCADEMGEVCRAFERMRLALIQNNQKMWDMMEEQRRLNAAFAHDLRTPLTVLRGYADFLSKYYPTGKVTEEQLLENLDLINEQVMRLIQFTNTMKEVNTMEALEPKKRLVRAGELEKEIENFTGIMDEMGELAISCASHVVPDSEWNLDDMIFMEVLENLVSNALRYARMKVEVTLEADEEGGRLLLYVRDDGKGFTKEGLQTADRPYYSGVREKDEGSHYGMGLFICKFLCEKHGGELDIANSIDGGAVICAGFFAK